MTIILHGNADLFNNPALIEATYLAVYFEISKNTGNPVVVIWVNFASLNYEEYICPISKILLLNIFNNNNNNKV